MTCLLEKIIKWKYQRTSLTSLNPGLLLLLYTPELKCAISHSNVKQLLKRKTYDPPWHLSSFLSQMCKHYYPWVILSGVVKILSLFCPLLARQHHQNLASGEDRASLKDRVRWGENAMKMEQMLVWRLICGPDKGVLHEAAGIDGLLVRTGPLCEMFSKWLIYNKVAPGVRMQAELMQIDPTEIDWSAI